MRNLLNNREFNDEYVMEMASSKMKTKFEEIVETDNAPDYLISEIMKFFSLNIFRTTTLRRASNEIYSVLVHSKTFLAIQVTNFALKNDNPLAFTTILDLVEELVERFPTVVVEKVMGILAMIKMKASGQEELTDRVEEMIRGCDKMQRDETAKQKEGAKRIHRNRNDEYFRDEKPPPNDFTEIDLIPSIDALKNPSEEDTYIRRNKVKEIYDDALEYLDVHFRLTYNDFMNPLREAVKCYKDTGGQDRESRTKLRVYPDASLVSPKCDKKEGILYVVQFSLPGQNNKRKKKRKMNWSKSRRLIYGSIVLLTTRNLNTALVGTVVNRDEKMLQNSKIPQIDVKFFDAGHAIGAFRNGTKFDMLEATGAYFEAYRHVLKSLQDYGKRIKDDEEGESLPFEEHLLKNDSDIKPPQYLEEWNVAPNPANVRGSSIFERFSLMPGHLRMDGVFENLRRDIRKDQFRVLDKWPENITTSLDDSQMEALRQLITHRIAVVQGPPGTGKTYVTLKALRVLIDNMKDDDPPILIVAYTNHALDQLLEGILQFERRIVRIGSRSSSEVLGDCTLFKKRSSFFRQGSYRRFMDGYWETNDRMKDIGTEVYSYMQEIENVVCRAITLEELEYFQFEAEQKIYFLTEDQFFELESSTAPADEDGWEQHVDRRYLEPINSWLYEKKRQRKFKASQQQAEARNNVHNNEYNRNQIQTHNPYELLNAEVQAKYFQEKEEEKRSNVVREDELKQPQNDTPSGIIIEPMDIDDEPEIDSDIESEGEAEEDIEDFKREQNERKIDFGEEEKEFLEDNSQMSRRKRKQKNKREKLEKEQQNIRDAFVSSNRGYMEKSRHTMKEEELGKYEGKLYDLDELDRYRLQKIWRSRIIEQMYDVLVDKMRKYDEAALEKRRCDTLLDKNVLKGQRVIGMTTTGAARLVDLIREVKPTTIVCEEAAELTESQMIALFHSDLQHLILVGDHKQLRPSTSDYTVATRYKLEISLFERLMINNVPHKILQTQRRMRPEIAELVQDFYPNTIIKNHKSVTEYGNVEGMAHNLYCLSHTHLETSDSEARSHSNKYEAEIVVGLCNYLILQGYEDTEITVLTPYQGQFFLINRMFDDSVHKKRIRCIKRRVIDKYQGEENEIVILSLVRSNKQNSVGFVKTENRVDVALSRAKIGLYILGNLDMIVRGDRKGVWKKKKELLDKNDRVGDSLILSCQKHPNTKTEIKTAVDFRKVPEGGCQVPCEARLECGHSCPRPCHPSNHDDYQCRKPCNKKKPFADCDHKCPKRCYQKCGKCLTLVRKELPCGHEQLVSCSQDDLFQVKCRTPCDLAPLKCGHNCKKLCGEPCNCKQSVQLDLGCGHSVEVRCENGNHVTANSYKCLVPCSDMLQCGHTCPGICSACNPHQRPSFFPQPLSHKECNQRCDRDLICSHRCSTPHPCTQPCPPCKQKCPNRCIHSKCQKKCGNLCRPCIEPCGWSCPHHQCKKLCSEFCERDVCNEPCTKKLRCGHTCIGICGELCVKYCRLCHKKKRVWDDCMMQVILSKTDSSMRFIQLADCEHVIEVSALDRWMHSSSSQSDDEEVKSEAFTLKKCPAGCREPIRRSRRYGNIIKQTISDLETIKEKLHHNQPLSQEEKDNVHTAMAKGEGVYGSAQGHWFKCANGHFYYIGDCGGAMEVSKCNECGEAIGGRNHQLRADNDLGSEMDGARNAAWPSALSAVNRRIEAENRRIEAERLLREEEEQRRIERNKRHDARLRAEKSRRDIIEQQNNEFNEALKIDLEKKQQEEENERKITEGKIELERLEALVPAEPEESAENSIKVLVKCPNGAPLRRVFLLSHTLLHVFHWIRFEHKDRDFTFQLKRPWPKPTTTFDETFAGKTLQEIGLSKGRVRLMLEKD